MPLKIGCSKQVIRANTKKLIREGYPAKVAYAIANEHARKYKKKCPVNPPKRKPKGKKRKGSGVVSFRTKSGKRVTFRAKKRKRSRSSDSGSIFGLF